MVVDDTVVYRRVLSQAVEATGLCEVSKTAPNGIIALDWMKQRPFDVVLLDVFMPEMDGLETLKHIKRDYPNTEVIMISGDGSESVKNTVKALELGALEFILKPSQGDQTKNLEAITRMLKILFAQIQIQQVGSKQRTGTPPGPARRETVVPSAGKGPKVPEVPVKARMKTRWHQADLIVIASSTGGPVALEKVTSRLRQPLDVPLLIVQHMPRHFTKVLAQSLDQKSGLTIVEAEEGMFIQSGRAVIAAGGLHMTVAESGGRKVLRLLETDFVNGVRPAADVLFDTMAQFYKGQRLLVVVLTGMGSDGTRGVRRLQEQCEVHCITQNEETCVVYGMPRSIDEAGLSDESLHLEQIAARIESFGLRRR